MTCCHRGGLHECLVRAAPPDLTSLAACFGPLQPRRPVAPSRPPLAGCRPRESQLTPAQRLAPLPRCVAPRPPLAISRTMTTLTCAAVAGLWRASGPGAAVGRLCCQPAAPAAGWAQVLGFCRLACPQAALWRFRSRARPRPLIGSCGRGFLGRGRSAVVALHLSPTRSWRRIGHHRSWGEAHAASRLRGRRCRPAGSALARVDPVSGAEEPRSGCFAVTSLVLGHRKEGCSADIGSFSKLRLIFGRILRAPLKLQVRPNLGDRPKNRCLRAGEVKCVFPVLNIR